MGLTRKTVESKIDGNGYLDLRNMGIEEIPVWLAEYQIVGLYLVGNKISKLPENINTFKYLKLINLSHNLIESLPDGICSIHSLEYLLLEGNKLTHLPEKIGDLSNLLYLNVTGNNIKYLPDSLADLKEIYSLDLGNNPIDTIPDLSHLNKLKFLDLWGTKIDISKNIKNLPVTIEKIFVELNKDSPEYVHTLKLTKGVYIVGKKVDSIPSA